jgi:predicted RNA-binding Zn ribbon-like protein
MTPAPSLFPVGWTHDPGGPADDLDVAVLLVNTQDILANPQDRLVKVDWFVTALLMTGRTEDADAIGEEDAAALRTLRQGLRATFLARTVEEAAGVLNPMLLRYSAVPQLVPGAWGGAGLVVAPGAAGLAALEARLPAALAAHVARHGTGRLGTCFAVPCDCVYVDRTRAGNRRYCCDQCNDRAASAAYRRRKTGC